MFFLFKDNIQCDRALVLLLVLVTVFLIAPSASSSVLPNILDVMFLCIETERDDDDDVM
jgi:hypothetical protein